MTIVASCLDCKGVQGSQELAGGGEKIQGSSALISVTLQKTSSLFSDLFYSENRYLYKRLDNTSWQTIPTVAFNSMILKPLKLRGSFTALNG